ncbi:MAG: metal-sensing transcriptional repressor [Pseudomonadota bacterium]|nr:metal-sensing transcriptional repressor [Pseudomonadota bacterium]
MSIHSSHPAIIKRLKRAGGHLASIIAMLDEGRPCVEIAQQMQAVESAINSAKKALIHDHIGECLEHVSEQKSDREHDIVSEFRAIAKYL